MGLRLERSRFNVSVETANAMTGRLRDKSNRSHLFLSLMDARAKIKASRRATKRGVFAQLLANCRQPKHAVSAGASPGGCIAKACVTPII